MGPRTGRRTSGFCRCVAMLLAGIVCFGVLHFPLQAQAAIPDTSFNASSGAPFSAVDPSYFADAIFIGDSRMKGFVLWSGLPDLQPVVAVGWRAADFFSKKKITISGHSYTGAEAVRLYSFSKAYIGFGLNELNDTSPEVFAVHIGQIVDYLRTLNPEVTIYVELLLPINPAAAKDYPKIHQSRVNQFNAALVPMCQEKKCVYLDVASTFTNEKTGMMYDGLTWDGVHVTDKSMYIWRDFILAHGISDVVPELDRAAEVPDGGETGQ